MAVVERISHRVAVMYLGQIVEIGPRRAVFENPQHRLHAQAAGGGAGGRPGARRRKRALISGEIPSPIRARRRRAASSRRCVEVGPGHFVATHRIAGAY